MTTHSLQQFPLTRMSSVPRLPSAAKRLASSASGPSPHRPLGALETTSVAGRTGAPRRAVRKVSFSFLPTGRPPTRPTGAHRLHQVVPVDAELEGSVAPAEHWAGTRDWIGRGHATALGDGD